MATRYESLTKHRLSKLGRIRERGIDPYPARCHRTHQVAEAMNLFSQWEAAGGSEDPLKVTLAGRILGLRSMGKVTFMDLRDGSGKVQIYFRKDQIGDEAYQLLKELDASDFIEAEGTIFRTATGEITLNAASLAILCKSLQPLPEKWHGLADVEKRYRQRYLDLLSNEDTRNVFLLRSRIVAALRRFMDSRGFLEVETPILLPIAAGAMAHPFSTHHNALDMDLYLRIATELHLKRLIVGGLDKVYEIGRVFRNEGISTKHNPEFTTMESYEAYADYRQVMAMVEEIFSYLAREVLGTTRISIMGEEVDLSSPWRKVSLYRAVYDACGIDLDKQQDAPSLTEAMRHISLGPEVGASRGRLVDKIISSVLEPSFTHPTFLLDYPVEMSPLAKRKADNPSLVERFEGFIAGMEIANAFTELNDPIEQRERLRQQEELRALLADEEWDRLDEDFLLALEHGMPPTGGLGVGIDRMVMVLTGQPSIRDVILFPQLRSK